MVGRAPPRWDAHRPSSRCSWPRSRCSACWWWCEDVRRRRRDGDEARPLQDRPAVVGGVDLEVGVSAARRRARRDTPPALGRSRARATPSASSRPTAWRTRCPPTKRTQPALTTVPWRRRPQAPASATTTVVPVGIGRDLALQALGQVATGPPFQTASSMTAIRSRSARAVTSRRRTPSGSGGRCGGERRGEPDHDGLLLLRLESGRHEPVRQVGGLDHARAASTRPPRPGPRRSHAGGRSTRPAPAPMQAVEGAVRKEARPVPDHAHQRSVASRASCRPAAGRAATLAAGASYTSRSASGSMLFDSIADHALPRSERAGHDSSMARVWIFLFAIELVLVVLALISCISAEPGQIRALPRFAGSSSFCSSRSSARLFTSWPAAP